MIKKTIFDSKWRVPIEFVFEGLTARKLENNTSILVLASYHTL